MSDDDLWRKVLDELAKLGVRDVYKKTIDNIKNYLDRSKRQTRDAQLRADEVRKLMGSLKDTDEIIDENERLKAENSNLKAQIVTLRQEIIDLQSDNQSVRGELVKAKESIENYEQVNKKFIVQIKNTENLLSDITEAVSLHKANPQAQPQPGQSKRRRFL